jgi:hypothetical protein
MDPFQGPSFGPPCAETETREQLREQSWVGSPLVAAAANDASCAAAEWDAVRLGIGGLAEHTARWLRRYSSP